MDFLPVTWAPLTNVPLDEPRSVTKALPAAISMRACCQETAECSLASKGIWLAGSRPSVIRGPSTLLFCTPCPGVVISTRTNILWPHPHNEALFAQLKFADGIDDMTIDPQPDAVLRTGIFDRPISFRVARHFRVAGIDLHVVRQD